MRIPDRAHCNLCPRACGGAAYCGVSASLRIARTGLHRDEEPCISGTRGSGTIFFSGCNLGCVFCQNAVISQNAPDGRSYTPAQLADTFRALEDAGAHNINLVTPSHYAVAILAALREYRPHVPVVWNTSSYDRPETIDALAEYVSVWLADLKFRDSALSARLANAPNYFEIAYGAISRMRMHAPREVYGADGLMREGVIVRHLVLPSHTDDSIAVLDSIAAIEPKPVLSLMSQYLPLGRAAEFPEINRRITSFEYNKVLRRAEELGLAGYSQERASASAAYVPIWGEYIDGQE